METLLAEKLETIVSRSKTNTRMRDFYDVYILTLEFKEKINIDLLADALTETAKSRGTYESIKNGKNIIADIFNSDRVKVCSQTSWACPEEREDGIEF